MYKFQTETKQTCELREVVSHRTEDEMEDNC